MTGIRDLARHLNISIGTVSRALNDRPDVNQKTKALVLKTAHELGYQPNQAGRSLRKGNTNIVGFVVETDSAGMMQTDLFFIRVFDGMQSVLTQHGLDLVALISPSTDDPDSYLKKIVAQRITDAIVLSSIRRNDSRISYLSEKNLPFATLGRSLVDGGQPWLDLDFDGVVNDAVTRLAAKGHEKIALALPKSDLNFRQIMIQSYKSKISSLGIDFDDRLIVENEPGDNGGVILARQLLQMSPKPTAVMYSDNILPFGLYRGLAEIGLTPGKDLSIIGIGADLVSLLTPNLTYYRFDLFDLGVKIAEALVHIMKPDLFEEPVPPIRECLPFSFVEGNSVHNIS